MVQGGTARTKSCLEIGKDTIAFDEVHNSFENHGLENFGKGRGEGDRAVGGRRGSRLTRLKKRNDFREFPSKGKVTGGPREIKDMKKSFEGRGRQVPEEGVGDALRIAGG